MHSRKLLSVTDYSSFQLLLLICALLATSWVCGYSIYFIIADANWILGDNELIVSTTVVGKLAPTLIGAGGGRFWPLGFQEFNLFIAAGDAPTSTMLGRL